MTRWTLGCSFKAAVMRDSPSPVPPSSYPARQRLHLCDGGVPACCPLPPPPRSPQSCTQTHSGEWSRDVSVGTVFTVKSHDSHPLYESSYRMTSVGRIYCQLEVHYTNLVPFIALMDTRPWNFGGRKDFHQKLIYILQLQTDS